MSVTIKVDTGFVGAIHEMETDLTVEEWKELTDNERHEIRMEAINENIDAYAVDETDLGV